MGDNNTGRSEADFWAFMESEVAGAANLKPAFQETAAVSATPIGITAAAAREIIRSPTDCGEDPPVIIEARDAEHARQIVGDAPVKIFAASSGWAQEDTGEDPAYLQKWHDAERAAQGRKPPAPGMIEFRIV
jgi:hypothetical protein